MWYIASCEGQNENGTYRMEHLTRAEAPQNLLWKHPAKADSLDLYPSSIVCCKRDGDWNVFNQRSMTFLLRNHNDIASLVEEI